MNLYWWNPLSVQINLAESDTYLIQTGLRRRRDFCGKVKNCLSPVVCFESDMVQGLNWCHEDLVSLHFSALPLAMLASFPGFLWWPWNLQAQILFIASRPMGKHDAFLSLVPGKASLAVIRLWAHSPNQLLGLDNATFQLTKTELVSVLCSQPLKQGVLEPKAESTLPKAHELRIRGGGSWAKLGCCYLKKDTWMLGGKVIDVCAE